MNPDLWKCGTIGPTCEFGTNSVCVNAWVPDQISPYPEPELIIESVSGSYRDPEPNVSIPFCPGFGSSENSLTPATLDVIFRIEYYTYHCQSELKI